MYGRRKKESHKDIINAYYYRVMSMPHIHEPNVFRARRAKNGLILIDDEENEIVYQEDEENEHDGFANFLRTLEEQYGPCDGRYDEKRIWQVPC